MTKTRTPRVCCSSCLVRAAATPVRQFCCCRRHLIVLRPEESMVLVYDTTISFSDCSSFFMALRQKPRCRHFAGYFVGTEPSFARRRREVMRFFGCEMTSRL